MKRHVAILLAVLLQVVVLGWEYVGSVLPRWTGRSVALVVHPVDPRSWFSGNYAALTYDVASLPAALYRGPERTMREGEVVYVSLVERDSGWQASELSLEPPPSGVFMRGRLASGWSTYSSFRVRYGIEAYFAPKEEALAIEREVRERPHGQVKAEVRVASSGRAALVGLLLP